MGDVRHICVIGNGISYYINVHMHIDFSTSKKMCDECESVNTVPRFSLEQLFPLFFLLSGHL